MYRWKAGHRPMPEALGARRCGACLPLRGGTRHPGVTADQASVVTRNCTNRIAVEGATRGKAQDNVRAIASDGAPLSNADVAAIVAENANGIAPDGHTPGNQLGYGTRILCPHPLGIVLDQNRTGDIAEDARTTEP